jgi:hypothetical protein
VASGKKKGFDWSNRLMPYCLAYEIVLPLRAGEQREFNPKDGTENAVNNQQER